MLPRLFRHLLVLGLASALLVSCSPRRGGGGGGGGGGDDDDVSAPQTGPGRNVGDAAPGGTINAGNGDSTLYVVNYSGETLTYVSGWQCNEEQWFDSGEGIEVSVGRYLEVRGLVGGCWYFEAYGREGYFDHQAEGIDGAYTWAIGSPSTGDDDDDDVGDDDDIDPDAAWVWVYNKSSTDFYELVAFRLDTFEQVQLCSFFGRGSDCSAALPASTWAIVAFTDEGRMENSENCWLGSDETFPLRAGDELEIVLSGEVQCGF